MITSGNPWTMKPPSEVTPTNLLPKIAVPITDVEGANTCGNWRSAVTTRTRDDTNAALRHGVSDPATMSPASQGSALSADLVLNTKSDQRN